MSLVDDIAINLLECHMDWDIHCTLIFHKRWNIRIDRQGRIESRNYEVSDPKMTWRERRRIKRIVTPMFNKINKKIIPLQIRDFGEIQ